MIGLASHIIPKPVREAAPEWGAGLDAAHERTLAVLDAYRYYFRSDLSPDPEGLAGFLGLTVSDYPDLRALRQAVYEYPKFLLYPLHWEKNWKAPTELAAGVPVSIFKGPYLDDTDPFGPIHARLIQPPEGHVQMDFGGVLGIDTIELLEKVLKPITDSFLSLALGQVVTTTDRAYVLGRSGSTLGGGDILGREDIISTYFINQKVVKPWQS